MENRYDPYNKCYQRVEFDAEKLTRKGRKVVKEAESYTNVYPQTKDRLASKAIDLAGLFGPQFAAAVTIGFSRLFNRSLTARSSTKSIPTKTFDRS